MYEWYILDKSILNAHSTDITSLLAIDKKQHEITRFHLLICFQTARDYIEKKCKKLYTPRTPTYTPTLAAKSIPKNHAWCQRFKVVAKKRVIFGSLQKRDLTSGALNLMRRKHIS